MKRLALLLLFAACCTPRRQHPGECVTVCGMHVPPGLSCLQLGALEARTVRVLGAIKGWKSAEVCDDLNGWELLAMNHDPDDLECATGWKEAGICVVGFTRRDTRAVAVLKPITMSTYAHEVVHVVDFARTGTAGHCGWKARGITAALFELSGETDESEGLDQSCKRGDPRP